ncbi:MAG: hypothetical protein ISR83_06600 [Candidatus Marinimicrobia bacterium]|nr:hypothetical protein [Candidatus Neomarinimicrobiota bacterium]
MRTTLLNIDIKNFKRKSESLTHAEIKQRLLSFYKLIENELTSLPWEIVKTIGDAVLINCHSQLTDSLKQQIDAFFTKMTENFDVTVLYRECEVENEKIKIRSYQCNDVFGKDVNNLFVQDEKCTRLG